MEIKIYKLRDIYTTSQKI